MHSEKSVEQTPAIGISVQNQISEGRTVVFQCFVPFDADAKTLNGALDKVVAASERQEARARLPSLHKRLAELVKARHRAAEDMARLDAEHHAAQEARMAALNASGRREHAKPSAQQLAHDQKNAADRANAVTSIERGEADISDLKGEIAETETMLRG